MWNLSGSRFLFQRFPDNGVCLKCSCTLYGVFNWARYVFFLLAINKTYHTAICIAHCFCQSVISTECVARSFCIPRHFFCSFYLEIAASGWKYFLFIVLFNCFFVVFSTYVFFCGLVFLLRNCVNASLGKCTYSIWKWKILIGCISTEYKFYWVHNFSVIIKWS